MRELLIIIFASSLMLSCSEEAEEMMEKSGDAADEMAEEAMHKADDAADAVTQMNDDMNSPQVEPLPDWDSLPPIEEEMASEDKANKMIDKASEVVKEIAEEGTSKAEKMVEEDEEMIKKE